MEDHSDKRTTEQRGSEFGHEGAGSVLGGGWGVEGHGEGVAETAVWGGG